MKVLALRMDRLGDVLMSLPAIELLRKSLPDNELALAVKPEVAEAIRPYLKSRSIQEWPVRNGQLEWTLARPQAAVVLNAAPRAYRQLFTKRVPVRFGMYSSLPSFLFLTDGLRQRRSRADRSEAIYNAELVASFLTSQGKPADFAGEYSPLVIPEDENEAAQAGRVLQELGVSGPFLVVHPGMGGSALNLSVESYVKLIRTAQRQHPFPLVLSRGPAAADRELTERLSQALPDAKTIPAVSLGVLRELFRQAAVVIAPSTGPLHLAHYVGTTTIGLYSPVRSHRPLRWQPWGGEGRSLVLTPQVDCPGKRECIGERCPQYLCMEKTSWDLLLDKASDFIGASSK